MQQRQSKLSFFILAYIGFTVFFSVWAPSPVGAQKIELEAPPLLWEEQPEKKKPNDAEYWQRKYNLKPKVQTDTAEKTTDKTVVKSDEKSTKKTEETSSLLMNKMGQGKEDMDEYKVITPTDQSDPKTDAKTENRAGSVLIEEQNPPCDFKNLIGEDITTLDFAMFEGRPVRVVYPQQNITRDVVSARINLKIGRDNIITKIACF